MLSLLFVALKIPALRPAISDENIYFYMAWRMSDGVLPYRDFFYANPPGLLAPAAVLVFLFGPKFLMLKALPVLAALGALVLTYALIARRAGPLTAFLCVCVWILGGTFIRASSHWTGINVTTFLLVLAIFLLQQDRGAWSGLALAVAGLTKTYGLVALPALWLGAILRGRDVHRRFLLGFFPLTLAANVLLLTFGGGEFIRQTIRYHMAKPSVPGANRQAIETMARQSTPWIVVCVIALLLAVQQAVSRSEDWRGWMRERGRNSRGRPDSLLWICLTFVISYVLFMGVQKRVFSFYVLPVFPVLCILLGDGVGRLESASPPLRVRLPLPLRKVPVAAFLAVPIIASISGVIDYVKHEVDFGFPEAYPIAEYVRETTGPDETLFGFSGAAPLVGFLAERRLANDEADTNAMRFRSGMDDVGEVFGKAEKDNLRYLVALWRRNRDHIGIFRIKEFIEEVESRYRIERSWPSNKGTYYLYAPPAPSPMPAGGG